MAENKPDATFATKEGAPPGRPKTHDFVGTHSSHAEGSCESSFVCEPALRIQLPVCTEHLGTEGGLVALGFAKGPSLFIFL